MEKLTRQVNGKKIVVCPSSAEIAATAEIRTKKLSWQTAKTVSKYLEENSYAKLSIAVSRPFNRSIYIAFTVFSFFFDRNNRHPVRNDIAPFS